MSKRKEIAKRSFEKQFNCAQTILYIFSRDLKFDVEIGLKMFCGFGGGISRNQEVCGAVTGGCAILGYKFGTGLIADGKAVDKTYAKIQELMSRIKKKHGSYLCKELIPGIDLKQENGRKKFKEDELKTKVCLQCIYSVIDILEEMLKQ